MLWGHILVGIKGHHPVQWFAIFPTRLMSDSSQPHLHNLDIRREHTEVNTSCKWQLGRSYKQTIDTNISWRMGTRLVKFKIFHQAGNTERYFSGDMLCHDWFLTVMGRSWLFPRKPTVWHDVHFYLSKSQRTCTTRSLILTFDQARFLRPTLIKTSKDAKACLVHVPVLIRKIWQNQTWKDLFIVFLYVFFVFHIFFLFNLSTFNLWSFSCH